jgi:hypothetical protein
MKMAAISSKVRRDEGQGEEDVEEVDDVDVDDAM